MINKKTKNVGFAIAVLIIIGLITLISVNKIQTANVIKQQEEEQKYFEDWLPENCNCVERNRLKCSLGFELDKERELCVNKIEKTFTNVLLGCSVYSCGEGNYTFNLEKEKWEK
ncbi:MAG: hypothetical protein ABIH49_00405 [archaeon]